MTAEQNKSAATEGKNTPFLPKGMDKSVSYRAVRGSLMTRPARR